MTRDELLELLRNIEFVGYNEFGDDGTVSCSQCLGRVLQEQLPRRSSGHDADCELAKAIAWLDDDGNRYDYVANVKAPAWVLP